MCIAQGHNAVPPVRLDPVALRSRAKQFTTKSLHSLSDKDNVGYLAEVNIQYGIRVNWKRERERERERESSKPARKFCTVTAILFTHACAAISSGARASQSG